MSLHDELHHECGVFGVYGLDEAAVLTTLGLHSLQHRKKVLVLLVLMGKRFILYVEGLVGDNFNDADTISKLPGRNAVGHVRYSTTGDSKLDNIQPFFADLACGGFSCAHNGNLTNTKTLRKELVESGSIFRTTSDTEVIFTIGCAIKGNQNCR